MVPSPRSGRFELRHPEKGADAVGALGARNGLLVKNRIALERARELQVIIFDKTGTLTKGQPALVRISGADESELLRLAASVEADSEHPLARTIVAGPRCAGSSRPQSRRRSWRWI